MQFEVGNIVEGKVTGITKFGAFVELPGGKTGMVHISEVSTSYVKEISDHLSENDIVKVKVLSISDDGKVSLSIKKCQDSSQVQPQARSPQQSHDRERSSPPPRRPYQPKQRGWQPKQQPSSENMSFEDMLSKFKQTSDDKISDLKKSGGDSRRGSRRGTSSR